MSRLSPFRTLIVVGIFCSAPALAQASQQQFGDTSVNPPQYLTHRSSPPDGTSIDVSYFVGGGLGSFAPIITQAANVWNAAGANVQLVVGGPGSPIQINGFPLGSVPGGTSPLTTTGVLGAYPDGTLFRQITNAAVIVNTNIPGVPWYLGVGSLGADTDFLSFMIQQFGFALGLGNTNPDAGSVMTPLLAGVTQQTLSAGDVAALQTLYGAPEPATWALFGVGLAVLGAAKKSRRRSTPAL